MKQKTLKKEIELVGVGVHLGLPSRIILKPASINSGIIFINPKFLNEKIEIGKIIPESAIHASVLKSKSWMVSTVEHLMAAISCLGIDNLIIEIEGIEVPILDGSALTFVDKINSVGLLEQEAEKYFLTPIEVIKFEDEKGRLIELTPAKTLKDSKKYDTSLHFDYFADFDHPLVGKGNIKGNLSVDYFIKELAAARTFGFLEQLPYLRRHGLAKGTTLGNTVVIGEEEFLNEQRCKDEFIKHKVLDLFGDLALLGKNLAGTIKASKTGHNFNRLVVKHYIENPKKWMLV